MLSITGRVDDYGRALIPIIVRHPVTDVHLNLEAWIDTAFTGTLLLIPAQIKQISLPQSSVVAGALADGSQVTFDAFPCMIDWCGQARQVQALAGVGKLALVGIGLLEDCVLRIDYPSRQVVLDFPSGAPAP